MSIPITATTGDPEPERRARLALSILQHRLAAAEALDGPAAARMIASAVEDARAALDGASLDFLTALTLGRALMRDGAAIAPRDIATGETLDIVL